MHEKVTLKLFQSIEPKQSVETFKHRKWMDGWIYKHIICFQKYSVNIYFVLLGNACFFLIIFDDNFVPTLIHTSALPLHWYWQHSQTHTAVYCETHCSMVTDSLAFGFDGHLDLKKLPVGTICQPPATLLLLFWQVVLLLPSSLAALAGHTGC